MSWNEADFLNALKTYLSAQLSGIQCYLVGEAIEKQHLISPPFVMVPDGESQNINWNETEIVTTIELLAVTDVGGSLGESVVGRDPAATWLGTSAIATAIEKILTTANLFDGLSMTYNQFLAVRWQGCGKSNPLIISDNIIWTSKPIRFEFRLRPI